jgi:hypothetical protein
MKNIIKRLKYASATLRDNEQYNDDPECNAEGESADSVDEVINMIENISDLIKGKDYDHVKISMISNMLKK